MTEQEKVDINRLVYYVILNHKELIKSFPDPMSPEMVNKFLNKPQTNETNDSPVK